MFLLFALLLGVIVGLITGGRPAAMLRLRLRWNLLVVLALAIQLVLFVARVPLPPGWAPVAYALSYLIAMVWLGRNIRVAGFACVALGAAANFVAIAGNGGRMPVDPALVYRAGGAAAAGAVARGAPGTNAVLAGPQTHFAWLSDRFLLGPPFPFPAVFSVGDLLIGLGVAWIVAAAMHSPAPVAAALPAAQGRIAS